MDSKFQKYIRDLILYCKVETFHGEYESNISWMLSPQGKEDSLLATIQIRADYLVCEISIYDNLYQIYKEQNYKKAGRTILHEIVHLYFEPIADLFLEDLARKETDNAVFRLEQQVQRVTNTIHRLLPTNWYMPEVVGKASVLTKKKK